MEIQSDTEVSADVVAITEQTCLIERSKVREILLRGDNWFDLRAVDALPIITAAEILAKQGTR